MMNNQWKLVPVEPTETMVINGFESEPDECFTDEEVWEQYQEMSGCQQAAFRAKLCWAAMLGAAPAPPQADTGEVARLTAERDALQQRLNAADQRNDELTAAPVIERQVMGRVYHFDDGARCHLTSEGRSLADDTPLYTSPPAPVSVVLPERKTVPRSDFEPFEAADAKGWNACLDKVKELNT